MEPLLKSCVLHQLAHTFTLRQQLWRQGDEEDLRSISCLQFKYQPERPVQEQLQVSFFRNTCYPIFKSIREWTIPYPTKTFRTTSCELCNGLHI